MCSQFAIFASAEVPGSLCRSTSSAIVRSDEYMSSRSARRASAGAVPAGVSVAGAAKGGRLALMVVRPHGALAVAAFEYLAVEDTAQAAQLVACGLRQKLRPTEDPDYLDLVRRYRQQDSFAHAVRAVADGMELDVLDVTEAAGAVLGDRAGRGLLQGLGGEVHPGGVVAELGRRLAAQLQLRQRRGHQLGIVPPA